MKQSVSLLLVVSFLSQSLFGSVPDHSFERLVIDAPNDIRRLGEIEKRQWNAQGNNKNRPFWGTPGVPQLRVGDGIKVKVNDFKDPTDAVPNGGPNPRIVSNAIHHQVLDRPVEKANQFAPVTDMFWAWGQFLDHDITLTSAAKVNGKKVSDLIHVPKGDPHFDPLPASGRETIAFSRSKQVRLGRSFSPVNDTTAFVDGSQIYGPNGKRARALMERDRRGRVTGYLNVSHHRNGPLLPYNDAKLENGTDDLKFKKEYFFLAGDVRANEHVALNSLHTVFVREHNYLVSVLRNNFRMPPEVAYEVARAIVIAELQKITYYDWLPLLLGVQTIPRYTAYNPKMNPGIRAFFSTAAFRFGHSMVSPHLSLAAPNGKQIGLLKVSDAFKDKVPVLMTKKGFMEEVLHGLTRKRARRLDPFITNELRNFLFGLPHPIRILQRLGLPLGIPRGLDLAALNVKRSRDHGILRYNDARVAYGLEPVSKFEQIHPELGANFRKVYGTSVVQSVQGPAVVDNLPVVDSWCAGLAEPPAFKNALVGPLFHTAIRDQFIRLRDGDRFWYQLYLPKSIQQWVNHQTLRSIIIRNTGIRDNLPPSPVFEAKPIQG